MEMEEGSIVTVLKVLLKLNLMCLFRLDSQNDVLKCGDILSRFKIGSQYLSVNADLLALLAMVNPNSLKMHPSEYSSLYLRSCKEMDNILTIRKRPIL